MKLNLIWLIAAAIFLYAGIVELIQGSPLTSVALFLLAAVFGYAGFRGS
jgi:hypothetical protein